MLGLNEYAIKLIFGFGRTLLAPVTIYLASKGILTEDETVNLIMIVASIIVSLVGTWINKKRALTERNTALAMPNVSTPAEVKTMIAEGTSAPPSAKQNEVPEIKGTGDGQ